MPLVINADNAAGFADWLVRQAPHEATPNRAEPPAPPPDADTGSFRDRMGNALLAGCIIEEAHQLPAFPQQVWGRLYRAIGEMSSATEWFTPQSIIANCNSPQFYDQILRGLNARLLRQAIELAVPDAQQSRQRAEQKIRTATQALRDAVGANVQELLVRQQQLQAAQQSLQEADQNVTLAQNRLQAWEAIQLTVSQAENNAQYVQQMADQILGQYPLGSYAPIPDLPTLAAALRGAFTGLAQHHQGSVQALDPTRDDNERNSLGDHC